MEEKPRETPEETMGKGKRPEAQAEIKETTEEAGKKEVYTEEREVRSGQLMDTLNQLIYESTVRHIRLKNKAGRVLVDIPVWAAAVGGSAAVILAPVLSAIGVLGGALAGFTIEIEREVEKKEEGTAA
ncbi:MAG TPA: DUF4342 domain-containing protein [Anaerolineae bacterium]|jgi:hypothetical protein|nr:DUF4342 domain-containing protein [Anaerolineae bacterium]